MNTKICPSCASEISIDASRCPNCRIHQPDAPSVVRPRQGRVIAGVCLGLAQRIGLEPLLVRIAFCLAAFFTGGIVIGIYVMIWALTPERGDMRPPMARFFSWLGDSNEAPGRL